MKLKHQAMLILGFLLGGAALLQLTSNGLTAAPADRKGDLAVVDIEKLTKDYEDYKVDNQKFLKFRDDKIKSLQVREYLNPNEWDELEALEVKKNPKPEEEKRLEELRSLSDRRRQLKRELESKVDITDKDREELERIRKIPRSNQVRLEDMNVKLQNEIEQEYSRLSEKLRTQVTGVYERLSKNRGFTVVLDKTQVQWSSSDMDVTDEVLKQLNKK
jgi:Skp family chaperone for outer membrane proteins